MKPKTPLLFSSFGLTAALLPLGIRTAEAATQYWDSTITSNVQPAAGTWGTNNFWTADGTALVAWTSNSVAVLAGTGATASSTVNTNAGTDGTDGVWPVTTGASITATSLFVNNTGFTLTNNGSNILSLSYANSTGSSTTDTNSALYLTAGKTFNIGSGTDTTVLKMNISNAGYSAQTFLGAGAVLNINAGASVVRDNSPANGGIRFVGNGTVNLYGTLSLLQGNDGIRISERDGDTVSFNVKSGGAINVNTTAGNESGASLWIAGGAAGTGSGNNTLTIESGGAVSVLNTTTSFGLTRNAGPTSTLNLAGTLTVPKIISLASTATFNFTGGTLKANATQTSFMTGLTGTTVNVNSNSTIDNNGFNIGIGQAIGGTAGLTFSGSGTTTLSGVNTYTGTTTVNSGTLTLADNAKLSFKVTNSASNKITGSGTAQIDGDFAIDTSAVTSPAASYVLADAASVTYGPTFSITGWVEDTPGVWKGGGWVFTTSNSTLVSHDSDADGMEDAWEIATFGNLTTATTSSDYDSDQNKDLAEFIAGTDPKDANSWPDSDSDGLNDGWEMASFGNLTTATVDDTDGDALADLWEDLHYGDNSGTVEPSDLTVQNNAAADDDSDHNTNGAESLAGTNPVDANSWPDSDADGVNDGWEMFTFSNLATATATDHDGDKLADLWEDAFYGDNSGTVEPSDLTAQNNLAADGDGDGALNYQESVSFTDPTDNSQFPDLDGDGSGDGHILLADDVNATPPATTSFTGGMNWENGQAPAAGSIYLANKRIRTPDITTAGSSDFTFAGDRLTIAPTGILTLKNGNGTATANLRVAGGKVENGTGNNTPVTLAGTLTVTAPSTFDSPNAARTITIDSALGGTGSLAFTGTGTIRFNSANTWTGSLSTANPFVVEDPGSFNFVPTVNGTSNNITGAGAVTFHGDFNINTSGTDLTVGNIWNLVASTGTRTYGATFNIPGFIVSAGTAGSRTWTKNLGAVDLVFYESTGALLVINPDLDGDGMSDSWEIANFGGTSRDGTGDYDSDHNTDLAEFLAGTEPDDANSWPDSDGDNLNDGWEIATFGNLTTATAYDNDGDGWDDLTIEDATFGDNDGVVEPADLAQAPWTDADGDGATNKQEMTVDLTDPNSAASFADANGDGIADGAKLLAGDANSATTISYDASTNWSDHFAPLAGINYYVAVNSLRAPYTADGDYTFAGARLVMATGGNLLFKSNSNHTIGNLVLDGGRIHNGSNGNGLVTVGGNILVRGASEMYAQNGSLTVNSLVSGTGNLSLVAANGTVTFTGANTWTGSLAAESPFALGATGAFNFVCGASGVNNAITGSKAVTLDGTVNIDTTGAGSTIGDAWNLVANTGAKNYGATFSITGFSRTGTAWKKTIDAARAYQFEQTTGVLAVVANSDSDNDGMLDAWETTHFGNLAQTAAGDPDADGTDNLAEFRLGLDPNSSASRFGIATTDTNPADGFTIAWPSAAGVTFTVKRTTDMATWTTLTATLPAGSGGSTQYTDPSPPAGKAFYRVELNP